MREVKQAIDKALEHLAEASEKLSQSDQSWAFDNVDHIIGCAESWLKHALGLLDEPKEETCEKP